MPLNLEAARVAHLLPRGEQSHPRSTWIVRERFPLLGTNKQ